LGHATSSLRPPHRAFDSHLVSGPSLLRADRVDGTTSVADAVLDPVGSPPDTPADGKQARSARAAGGIVVRNRQDHHSRTAGGHRRLPAVNRGPARYGSSRRGPSIRSHYGCHPWDNDRPVPHQPAEVRLRQLPAGSVPDGSAESGLARIRVSFSPKEPRPTIRERTRTASTS